MPSDICYKLSHKSRRKFFCFVLMILNDISFPSYKDGNFFNYLNKSEKWFELLKDIEDTNYTITGKKYGVSDNAIRKWIKQYKKESKCSGSPTEEATRLERV